MDHLPQVNVLLSTHRSGRFLAPLLESIANQEGVEIQLIFHLDDGDLHDLAQIETRFPGAVRTDAGAGIGVPGAYIALAQASSGFHGFWAFADQDDVWSSRKLKRAVDALALYSDRPALWMCAFNVLKSGDGDSWVVEPPRVKKRQPAIGNALVETFAPGCCMVWNEELHSLLKQTKLTDPIVMHDSWLYLLAAACGVLIFDRQALVQYRIHEDNTIGLSAGLWPRLRRLLRGKSVPNRISHRTQSKLLLERFASLLSAPDATLVQDFSETNRFGIMRHLVRGRIYRESISDTALLSILEFIRRGER